MKLLSAAIPCYNSAAYMRGCIDKLLQAGDRLEIIIVDDGSQKDNTWEIALEYQNRYPGIVKAVHQENGGHGEAVNTGLHHAEGRFFKVVDSDDYLEPGALEQVLDRLELLDGEGTPPDMFICNFVYDKQGALHKKTMSYRRHLPVERLFTWEEAGRFRLGEYILMHSVIYRTELLKNCRLKLPAHTFYVDNIYVYYPLPHVKTMYYMDLPLYMYYIGREDQSVNEKVMIGRIDQQIRVTELMWRYYDLSKLQPSFLRKYMRSYLCVMMAISSILAIRSKDPQNMKKKDKLWRDLKADDPVLYRRLRWSFLGILMNLRSKAGLAIASFGYKLAQLIYGFN